MEIVKEPSRTVPILLKADVCVIGGGPAGIAAAIAGARLGVNVVLVEKYGILGGTATNSVVCHLDPMEMLGVEGIAREIYNRLKSIGAIEEPQVERFTVPYTFWESGCGFDLEQFKFLVQEMLERAGVGLILHSLAVAVTSEEGIINSVIIESKSGRQAIAARIFIDASGDGDVAAFSGAEYDLGSMALSPGFRIGNVDMDKVREYFKKDPDEFGMHPRLGRYMEDYNNSNIISGFQKIVNKAVEACDLDPIREVGFSFSLLPVKGQVAVNTFGIGGVDPLNVLELTKAEIEARKRIMQVAQFAKRYLPGFESSYLIDSGVQIGTRETRRIVGEHVLTLDEIEQSRKFEDAIVEAKWGHSDIHDPVTQKWTFKLVEGPYQIPYRCLLPKGIENLLVAGRCISVTHEALASTRIMPICMATGQAAGAASALAVRTNKTLRELDVTKLQQTLKNQGVKL